MNISLEVRVLRHALCLGQNGFMTAGLNDSALMKSQSAKGTGPEAAPIGYQTEFHFPDCGNAAGFAVAGVRIPAVGQVIDGVHFRLAQGLLRRILHHELPGTVGLGQPLGGVGVRVPVLRLKALGIPPGLVSDFFKGG